MNRTPLPGFAQVVLLILFLGLSLEGLPAGASRIQESLPPETRVGEWKRGERVVVYAGEQLYDYIDGGADIYLEYGFQKVVVAEYIHTSGKSVSVEIFEMAGPGSAYGIFTYKVHPEDERIPVGIEGRMASYYLNFWKGACLVTLTGFDDDPETRQGLRLIGQKIAERIPERGRKPRMARLLPEEDIQPRSLVYFRGPLGLQNAYPGWTLGISGFEEGIKADSPRGFTVIGLRYAEEAGVREAVGSLEQRLIQDVNSGPGRVEEFSAYEGKDRRGRRFFLVASGRDILFFFGDIGRKEAEAVSVSFVKRRDALFFEPFLKVSGLSQTAPSASESGNSADRKMRSFYLYPAGCWKSASRTGDSGSGGARRHVRVRGRLL